MGLEAYGVIRDHFEADDHKPGELRFPCNVCRHRHGTDKDEPCIRCDWNICSKEDDEFGA